MKITPATGPLPVETSLKLSESAAAARERAIQRLIGSQPGAAQETPAAVSIEQASANVSPPTPSSTQTRVAQGQKPSSEVTETTSPEVPKADPTAAVAEEPISSQYAVLARKEKQFRAKVQAQEAALRAREAAIAEREAKASQAPEIDKSQYIPKQKLTEETIETLLEAGLSYDQITEKMLQQQNPVDPQTRVLLRKMEEKIAKLEAEQEGTKKSFNEVQESNYKGAIEQIRRDVSTLVRDGDDYAAIRETDSVADVVELIEKTYKEDGDLLTVEEAAALVEKELVDRISEYARLSKIQQKIQSAYKPTPQNSVQSQGDKQPQPPKTLTNGMNHSGKLSARERAILAFKGELKKE